ncbi:MAG: glycosyl transferase family 1 [Oligoflexia bacterium]|nr:glycosyl transferase family 1 [Oligoflexia bacterium]
MKRKVLFFSEGVTLAHLARPLVLADALPREDYEIHFACSAEGKPLLEGSGFIHHPLNSISSARFQQAVLAGTPPYDLEVLHRYVAEDRKILQKVKPALVIGDFRLSLSVSARLEKVPYGAIANVQWSPFAPRRRFPVADRSHSVLRFLPVWMIQATSRVVYPIFFSRIMKPLSELRAHYGFPRFVSLEEAYTEADFTLYADVPGLQDLPQLPANHLFLGPILWSPPNLTNDWQKDLPSDRPCIYVTLGSSGNAALLPAILEALAGVDATLLVANAQNFASQRSQANVRSYPLLPGREVSERSSLVICNGGSSTAHQAIQAGVPVIGIPSNLDQYLATEFLVRKGAGILLRADRFSGKALQAAVDRALHEPSIRQAAKALGQVFAAHPARENFKAFVKARIG